MIPDGGCRLKGRVLHIDWLLVANISRQSALKDFEGLHGVIRPVISVPMHNILGSGGFPIWHTIQSTINSWGIGIYWGCGFVSSKCCIIHVSTGWWAFLDWAVGLFASLGVLFSRWRLSLARGSGLAWFDAHVAWSVEISLRISSSLRANNYCPNRVPRTVPIVRGKNFGMPFPCEPASIAHDKWGSFNLKKVVYTEWHLTCYQEIKWCLDPLLSLFGVSARLTLHCMNILAKQPLWNLATNILPISSKCCCVISGGKGLVDD